MWRSRYAGASGSVLAYSVLACLRRGDVFAGYPVSNFPTSTVFSSAWVRMALPVPSGTVKVNGRPYMHYAAVTAIDEFTVQVMYENSTTAPILKGTLYVEIHDAVYRTNLGSLFVLGHRSQLSTMMIAFCAPQMVSATAYGTSSASGRLCAKHPP
jgi:hypothetical protein